MQTSFLRKLSVYAALTAISVFAVGNNAFAATGDPQYNPPGDAVSPTFTGATINNVLTLLGDLCFGTGDGACGEAGSILGITETGDLGWFTEEQITEIIPMYWKKSATGESVSNTNTGDVIIGQSTNSNLQVKKDLSVTGLAKFLAGGIGGSGQAVGQIGGATGFTLEALGSNLLKLKTNGVDRVIVNSSGNIGIGTASPSKKLTVVGDIVSDLDTTNSLIGGNISADRTITAKRAMASSIMLNAMNLGLLGLDLVHFGGVSIDGLVVANRIISTGAITGKSIGNFYRVGTIFGADNGSSGRWRYVPCETGDIAVSCSVEKYGIDAAFDVTSFPSEETAKTKTVYSQAYTLGAPNGTADSSYSATVPAHSCYAKEWNSSGSQKNYIVWAKCFDPMGGGSDVGASCGSGCWSINLGSGLTLEFNDNDWPNFVIDGQELGFDQLIEQVDTDPLIFDGTMDEFDLSAPGLPEGAVKDLFEGGFQNDFEF